MQFKRITICIALAFAPGAFAADATLPEVVVTAPAMEQPLVVTTDPRKPRQPIPAQDGAEYLKTIPGFSVIRKGGTDGRTAAARRIPQLHSIRIRQIWLVLARKPCQNGHSAVRYV
jgi:outer membrane receptor protein involved in Fe transport